MGDTGAPRQEGKAGDCHRIRRGPADRNRVDTVDDGNRMIQFYYKGIFEEILDRLGETPLPPYIHEKLKDKERYQTVV